jgi:hypothetical protein
LNNPDRAKADGKTSVSTAIHRNPATWNTATSTVRDNAKPPTDNAEPDHPYQKKLLVRVYHNVA